MSASDVRQGSIAIRLRVRQSSDKEESEEHEMWDGRLGLKWSGALLLGIAFAGAAQAAAVTIDYELTALAAPGRYEIRYTATNTSLAAGLGWFSVDFDPALYDESSLLISSAGVGAWSEQILASLPIFGVPAQYDVIKTGGAPLGIGQSEAGFAVQFTWLGAAMPGAQAFTVYDPSSFNILDAGFTTAVPEPSSTAQWLLGLLGLAGLAATRNRPAPLVLNR
ncbi:MAG: hypothetical protein ABIN96_11865 [Rubrivivax sp.]